MSQNKKDNLIRIWRTVLIASLICLGTQLPAQHNVDVFPDAWIGVWEGELEIYASKSGANIPKVRMELHIMPHEEEGRWAWTLVYVGDTVRDERKYELVLKDGETNQYVIDEKNSILLDAAYLGHTLISRFSVNNSLLMINYSFEADKIIFDVFAGSKENPTRTGEEVEQVESIYSYPIGTRQRAVLQKRE